MVQHQQSFSGFSSTASSAPRPPLVRTASGIKDFLLQWCQARTRNYQVRRKKKKKKKNNFRSICTPRSRSGFVFFPSAFWDDDDDDDD